MKLFKVYFRYRYKAMMAFVQAEDIEEVSLEMSYRFPRASVNKIVEIGIYAET